MIHQSMTMSVDIMHLHLSRHQESNLSKSPNQNGLSSWSEHERDDVIFYTHVIYILPIVMGNMSVIFVYSQVKLLHTPSNCTILCLAVTDLLVGVVCIPITLAHHIDPTFFKRSQVLCFIGGPMRFSLISCTMSMTMLLAIDRYIAIRHSFWYASHMTVQKIILLAGCLVLIDIGVAAMVHHEVAVRSTRIDGLIDCTEMNIPKWLVTFLACYYASKIVTGCVCTVVVVSFAFQCIKTQEAAEGRFVRKRTLSHLKSDAALTATLMFLFVMLFIPTILLPLHIHTEDDNVYLAFGISLHFMFLNSSLNFCVYAMSKQVYRTAFMFLLTTRPCRWHGVSNVVRLEYSRQLVKKLKRRSSRKAQVDVHGEMPDPMTSLSLSRVLDITMHDLQTYNDSIGLDQSFSDENIDPELVQKPTPLSQQKAGHSSSGIRKKCAPFLCVLAQSRMARLGRQALPPAGSDSDMTAEVGGGPGTEGGGGSRSRKNSGKSIKSNKGTKSPFQGGQSPIGMMSPIPAGSPTSLMSPILGGSTPTARLSPILDKNFKLRE